MIKAHFDTSGFDALKRRIQQIPASENVSLVELFNSSFMMSNTKSTDFRAFLALGGYSDDADAFKAIPDAEFDDHVRKHSRFASWSEMKNAAAAARLKKHLGL